ncbi:AsmA family protein [Denitrobaculum tricleocarpae]|uniref:AsmA family protein n=1 Tax=Denitrobaculum tricleocarpae TaxID=2591009 RepID=A0A545TFB3_9PROT|nr:AsmA family protein [Denitrobaculum tricleocarpae]TQV75900.1 AsmA family protein [Denitrobaculum tricleocarpae]
MKKVLIGVAVLVVVVVAAAVAIPFFVPTEEIKTRITQGVESATGRQLVIAGDLSVSVLPSLEVVAEDISFSNAEGAADPNMASLQALRLKLQILPLISGNVQVDEFVLVDPVINLEIDENGKPNWEFASAPAADAAPAPSGEAESSGGAGSAISDISLGDIQLVNGNLKFTDAASGTVQEVSDINLAVTLTDLDSPFTADGSLQWNAKTINMAVTSEKPRGLTTGEEAPVGLSVETDVIKLGFEGSVATAAKLLVAGALDVSTPSIRDLAAWTGNPIEFEGTGLGPFSLAGKVDVDGATYSFTDAKIAIDEIEGDGSVSIATAGAKPQIDAALNLGVLDLNPYLPPAKEGEAAGGDASGGDSAAGSGSAEPADWSDDPIDASGLRAMNANFALTVAGILVQEIKVGQSALNVALKDGLLGVDLTELNLYDGKGQGKLSVDGRNAAPAISKSFAMSGISAEPLLTDAAGFDRLSGTGNMEFAITATGASQRQMVENLNGKGQVTFNDGAIKGINLAAMVRNAANAFLDPDASETQKTDFAELSGSFDIKNGLLSNQDLKLLSPLLRVEGKGTSDLPSRTVDYRVEPKAVASLEGQGGTGDASGLAVPVLVSGPWHDLSYQPDLAGAVEGLAKDPGKALESLGGDAGKALEGVLGGGDEEGGGVKLPEGAGDALKGLFGN